MKAWIAALALAACSASHPEDCRDGATQEQACGLNDRGAALQTCEQGRWGAPVCDDPDECTDRVVMPVACGLNARGTDVASCDAGRWVADGICDDPDECVDDASEVAACGLNQRGAQARRCEAGVWLAAACEDPDACLDGAVDHAPCGTFGAMTRTCTAGRWSDFAACEAPIVITAATRRDLVHDAKRGRLYITTYGHTGDGQVLSYDLAAQQFDPPLLSGGAFVGIDLSPDQDHLIVADATTDATHNWIYRIDLTTGVAQKISFRLGFSEAGTFSVVFTTNTEALVTSELDGSGFVPLRRVDLTAPEVVQSAGEVSESTLLARAADGSVVAYAEANLIPGEWGGYSVAGRSLTASQTGGALYEIAVERTAAQFATPTYDGLRVFSPDGTLLTTLGTPARRLPVGAVYSPVGDEVYLAWGGAAVSIDVYSTTTLQKLRDIAPLPGLFFWSGAPNQPWLNTAFNNGHLRISRDGTLLLATTPPSGIVVYPTGISLTSRSR